MEFLCVATIGRDGSPSVANKFLIRCEGNSLCFGDFAKGKTWANLKINPKVSIAVMDNNNLVDYQINGVAKLVNPCTDFKELLKEFSKKEVRFAMKRIIEGIRKESGQGVHQVPFPKRIVIWEIDVKEVVELGPTAELKKEDKMKTGKDLGVHNE